jgi:serine/threonine-protein kinase
MPQGSLLNATVGGYRLIDFIGAGGMGEVYRALDAKRSRLVAIKVLNLAKTAPNALERFRNEARIHAAVRHPNIATMYEYLELDGAPCIAMEYVDGETIDQRIRSRGSLPLGEALEFFERIVDAVGYLHSRGIIHRDLKTNNVKISESGVVKLLDFGIAKSHDSPRLTVSGAMIGTPQYVSPEQLHGAGADERTDLWSLGVLLYEMVTARLPFEADNVAAVMDRVARASFPAPSRHKPGLPQCVDDIVARCLKAKPDQRYQSAEALLTDVRAVLEPKQGPVGAPAFTRPRWSGAMRAIVARRVPPVAALAAAGVALAFLLYVVFAPGPRPDGAGVTGRADPPTQPGPPKDIRASPAQTMREIVLTLGEGIADVYSDTGLVGRTPHTVKAALGERVSLILRRDGYEDEVVNFVVTEALRPRFTYYLRPRLPPPEHGESPSRSFSARPRVIATALGHRHG